MSRIGSIALACVLCFTLAGCSLWGKKEDKTKDWSAQRLFNEAKTSMDDGDYETAINYFEKLDSRYPFGALAEQAQLDVAFCYYRYDEPASALAAADRFIKLHPRHPNVDYAYYLKGLVNFTQAKGILARFIRTDMSQRDTASARQSFDAFADLVRLFPNSRYAADARQRMIYLKNTLAEHEVHVADYYMRRGAYVAAANRARYVVENYQTTPAVPDALVIMVKAYTLLKLKDMAAESLRVLKLNYPHHAGVAEAEKLVAR